LRWSDSSEAARSAAEEERNGVREAL